MGESVALDSSTQEGAASVVRIDVDGLPELTMIASSPVVQPGAVGSAGCDLIPAIDIYHELGTPITSRFIPSSTGPCVAELRYRCGPETQSGCAPLAGLLDLVVHDIDYGSRFLPRTANLADAQPITLSVQGPFVSSADQNQRRPLRIERVPPIGCCSSTISLICRLPHAPRWSAGHG